MGVSRPTPPPAAAHCVCVCLISHGAVFESAAEQAGTSAGRVGGGTPRAVSEETAGESVFAKVLTLKKDVCVREQAAVHALRAVWVVARLERSLKRQQVMCEACIAAVRVRVKGGIRQEDPLALVWVVAHMLPFFGARPQSDQS